MEGFQRHTVGIDQGKGCANGVHEGPERHVAHSRIIDSNMVHRGKRVAAGEDAKRRNQRCKLGMNEKFFLRSMESYDFLLLSVNPRLTNTTP